MSGRPPSVRSEEGLWDGDAKKVIPEEFLVPEDHAVDLPSEYNDVTGTSWGDNLRALCATVNKRYETVEKDLSKATP